MSPDEIKVSYRRMIDEVGEDILIRRYTGTGQNRPYFDATVRARVAGYAPSEMVGDIKQGDRKVIALAEDLIAAQVALPLAPSANLKVVARGREMDVKAVDDSTRRVAGVLIAIEMQVAG